MDDLLQQGQETGERAYIPIVAVMAPRVEAAEFPDEARSQEAVADCATGLLLMASGLLSAACEIAPSSLARSFGL